MVAAPMARSVPADRVPIVAVWPAAVIAALVPVVRLVIPISPRVPVVVRLALPPMAAVPRTMSDGAPTRSLKALSTKLPLVVVALAISMRPSRLALAISPAVTTTPLPALAVAILVSVPLTTLMLPMVAASAVPAPPAAVTLPSRAMMPTLPALLVALATLMLPLAAVAAPPLPRPLVRLTSPLAVTAPTVRLTSFEAVSSRASSVMVPAETLAPVMSSWRPVTVSPEPAATVPSDTSPVVAPPPAVAVMLPALVVRAARPKLPPPADRPVISPPATSVMLPAPVALPKRRLLPALRVVVAAVLLPTIRSAVVSASMVAAVIVPMLAVVLRVLISVNADRSMLPPAPVIGPDTASARPPPVLVMLFAVSALGWPARVLPMIKSLATVIAPAVMLPLVSSAVLASPASQVTMVRASTWPSTIGAPAPTSRRKVDCRAGPAFKTVPAKAMSFEARRIRSPPPMPSLFEVNMSPETPVNVPPVAWMVMSPPACWLAGPSPTVAPVTL